jgi:hypothetical protein
MTPARLKYFGWVGREGEGRALHKSQVVSFALALPRRRPRTDIESHHAGLADDGASGTSQGGNSSFITTGAMVPSLTLIPIVPDAHVQSIAPRSPPGICPSSYRPSATIVLGHRDEHGNS